MTTMSSGANIVAKYKVSEEFAQRVGGISHSNELQVQRDQLVQETHIHLQKALSFSGMSVLDTLIESEKRHMMISAAPEGQ